MKSPFDGSELKIKSIGNVVEIYTDQTGGVYISSQARHQLKKNFSGWEKNTREVHLANLGAFPLPEKAVPLLNITPTEPETGEKMQIPAILQKSNIPIFFSKGQKSTTDNLSSVYIPAESMIICRYFHDMWDKEIVENSDEMSDALSGFLILSSFAGE